MSDVFISYSRKDRDFAYWLQRALQQAHRSVWVDTQDIQPAAAWRDEIRRAIDSSDAVICVLSPDYLTSDICWQEVAYALENKKRLVPIVRREVNPREANPALAALNWIFFRDGDPIPVSMQKLLSALDTDLDYVRSGTRLLVRAKDWAGKNGNPSFALRGNELTEAEQWLAGSAGKQPPPSQEQMRYIAESRKVATARQRRTIAVLTGGIIITLVLAILSTSLYGVTLQQKNTLAEQNRTLITQAIAGHANGQMQNNHIDQALLMSLAAVRQEQNLDSRSALFNALNYSPHLASVLVPSATTKSGEDYQHIEYSADGKTLMGLEYNLAGQPNTAGAVTLWDVATHTVRRIISVTKHNPSDSLVDAAINPDGTLLATQSQDGGVQLWNVVTGKLITNLNSTLTATLTLPTILFSPNGKWLAWSSSAAPDFSVDAITIVNVASQQVTRQIPLALQGKPLFGLSVSLAFSPDGARLAAGECNIYDPAHGPTTCTRSQLELFDIKTGSRLETGSFALGGTEPTSTLNVAFSPDGKTIALGGFDNVDSATGIVRFWDVTTGQISGTPIIANDDNIQSMAFSPDGQYLATADGFDNVWLWYVPNRSPVSASPLQGHSSLLNSVAFSPDGRQFATSSADRSILLWNLKPFLPASQLLGTDFGGGSQVSYSQDGTTMVSGGLGRATIWDARTGARLRSLPLGADNSLTSAAFSPDDQIIATGDNNANIVLWDAAKGTKLASLPNGHKDIYPTEAFIYLLAFSPDGHYMLSGGFDGELILWNLTTKSVANRFTLPLTFFAYGAAFSPDGKYLALTTASGIEVHQLSDDALVHALRSSSTVRALCFNQQDTLASLSSDGTIQLWNIQTGQVFGPSMNDGAIGESLTAPHIVFSPDGAYLLSSHDESFTLWDVRSRAKYVNTVQAANFILSATFSPDGRYLAVATGRGIDVRYARLQDWESQACAIAGRNLTHREWAELIPEIPFQQLCPNLPLPAE